MTPQEKIIVNVDLSSLDESATSVATAGAHTQVVGTALITGPTGAVGAAGPQGQAATVAVGSVTTGAAGSSAAVTNAGTSSAAVLNFTIPQGISGVLTVTGLKTANYTAGLNEFVPVDTTAGNITITLPTAPANGTRVGAKMVIQGATNTVTLAAGGTDVFNKTGGNTSVSLQLLNQGVQYEYTGGIWYGIAGDIGVTALDGRYQKLLSLTTTGTSGAATLTGSTLNIPQYTGGAGASDATTSAKGIVQLAGDLGGTAAAPKVPGLKNVYVQLAASPDALIFGTITRDANEAATSASVIWPDGTTGTYTADTVSSSFPGAVDAYHITYAGSTTVTYTQPTVTRDSNGAVTTRPALVVT